MKWNIKELVKDYAPPEGDELLFTEEDTDVLILKDIVHNYLETYDRTILLMYAELGSLRLVAKELNVSHTAAIKKMDQIKLQVMGEFYKRKARQLNKEIDKKIKNDTT